MAKKKKGGKRKKSTAKRAVSKKAKAKKSVKKAVKKSSSAKKVSGKFNLIVSFDPNHAGTAENELTEALKKIGEKPKLAATGVEGLFKVAVSDARKVVGRLRDLCHADPNLFVATHHYTPIDVWCKSELSQMQKNIKKLESGIGESEKWKMNLNKRHWNKMDGIKLIIKLTDSIDRENVDLSNPKKIVQVEIIGKEAGISLLELEDLFDVAEIKDEA
ncbi:hypothetical protein CMO88_00090 [Candidatus Woesearchaeota archaeon]|nr:hypothetical protein [Candidatus Woesearchaeota archaeon]|tara:strand:- start:11495 stop:12145 length:651 start_codon:yes stop_codon:yes gene_type:complete